MWCPPTHIVIVCGNIYNIYICICSTYVSHADIERANIYHCNTDCAEHFYANILCADINCANIDLANIDLDNIDCADVNCCQY